MTTKPRPVIAAQHLAREAVVYVRQSTTKQIEDHAESARVQLALREKAIGLGWRHPIVIDGDLGVSAGGYTDRPGFQELLTRIATGKVGIVLCFDASRLSRNSKDWAHLFELCRYFATLIADSDQIYDLARANDRLVMGIKGTVSEMELTLIRNRMRSGLDAKAARGELRFLLPVGYAHDPDDHIVFDPDQRVRHAVATMFEQFDRMTSVRQLALWYRDTSTLFPSKLPHRKGVLRWEIPTSNTLRKLLLHPMYAGTYVYGRRQTVVEYVDGKLHKREVDPRPAERAQVCIHDHHPGFITWDRFLANRRRITDNRPRWNMHQNDGAIREGLALLTGLLRCARCGSKIRVGYKKQCAIYYCDGGPEKGSRRCFSFGSFAIDRQVGDELCRALAPHALEASLQAAASSDAQRARAVEDARLQVEAAQYSADRAFEQFDQCDPKNRLVADTLEQRLNDKLAEVQDAKERHRRLLDDAPATPDDARDILVALGRDFPRLWNHPCADAKLRKRILRAAIREILVKPDDDSLLLKVTIHWQGGLHTQCTVDRPTRARQRSNKSIAELVAALAVDLDDRELARVLNMNGTNTPGGLRWTQDRVRDYRKQQRIRAASPDKKRDTLTMNQERARLGISHNAALALVRLGLLAPDQVAPFAPWRVTHQQLESESLQRAVAQLHATGRLPKGGFPRSASRTLRRR
jgi:DNA invertase Pin-like site-specific DNA recombinase